MVQKYFVAKNANPLAEHEVHAASCKWIPDEANRIYVGEHLSCHTAVIAAAKYFKLVNGCKRCSLACNKQLQKPREQVGTIW